MSRALQAARARVRSTPAVSPSLSEPTPHGTRWGGADGPSIRGVWEIWDRIEYQHDLDKRIAAPRTARSITIAVLSPRRASGNTTITALLGSLLAFVRRVPVLAVTSDPHLASLAPRPGDADSGYPQAVFAASDDQTRLSTQVGSTSDGLMVAAMPVEGGVGPDLDWAGYGMLFEQLRDSVGTLLLDCRGRLDAPATRAALEGANQLVLVTDDMPNSVDLVTEAATWLERHAPPLVLVVNRTGGRRELDTASLRRNLPFARGLVDVPYDRQGAQRLRSNQFSWAAAPKNWRIPVRELGALVTADWPRLGLAA